MAQLPELLACVVHRTLSLLAQVSSELIRVSILWHEMWHEALEEASRLYFGEQNVEGMLGVLLPLHEKIEQEQAVTLKEISFVQVHRQPARRSSSQPVAPPCGLLAMYHAEHILRPECRCAHWMHFASLMFFCPRAPRAWLPHNPAR